MVHPKFSCRKMEDQAMYPSSNRPSVVQCETTIYDNKHQSIILRTPPLLDQTTNLIARENKGPFLVGRPLSVLIKLVDDGRRGINDRGRDVGSRRSTVVRRREARIVGRRERFQEVVGNYGSSRRRRFLPTKPRTRRRRRRLDAEISRYSLGFGIGSVRGGGVGRLAARAGFAGREIGHGRVLNVCWSVSLFLETRRICTDTKVDMWINGPLLVVRSAVCLVCTSSVRSLYVVHKDVCMV